VEAVATLHKADIIHRDIKTENIFVAKDNQLVLGDFGIVFYRDGQRLTETYERVGSRDWMAPWAYRNERLSLDEVTPSLDIFPLAKVLWSMISGRNGFPFWEIDRDENNLEKMFPADPMIPSVNRLLTKCIVREEQDCIWRAHGMLDQIDRLINQVRRGNQRPDDSDRWPCRICGRGYYVEVHFPRSASFPFTAYVCDHCGHAEMFKLANVVLDPKRGAGVP
jgi:serine/threonine protein kinase